MATMSLALGAKTVTIVDESIDDYSPWPQIMERMMLPMLAAHGYMIQDLYEVEELKLIW